ncbi:hypothetical protein GCM10009682_16060 [Luedemannella flava]|uniref:Uncharacterized protein n=1 Tax=Luedemannella flava TaxID=349316 RepID=A0ABP4XWZ8_9ACTN
MSSNEDSRTAAMAVKTFAVPPDDPAWQQSHTREAVLDTALEWQKRGVLASFVEVKATSMFGVGKNLAHELVGCVAAAGEQLGLAWTSEQDSERWRGSSASGRDMTMRALADIRAHFSLGAAHGMANATLRTLLLSKIPGDAVVAADKSKQIKRNPAFSSDRAAWPTFNARLVTALEAGVSASGQQSVADLVKCLRDLRDDSRFQALEDRRGMDYHRWRPQSLPAGRGVPQSTLWTVAVDTASIGIGGDYPADPLADAEIVSGVATDGMDAVAEAMQRWLDEWPAALKGLGADLFG